jgi:simple sugar transport system permease protein
MMAIPIWLRMPGAFVLSVLLGLAASSLVLVAVHAPVLETFRAIYDGAVGSWSALESSLVFGEPIAFTGLAAAIAFRARVWNIGGEGQMVMGAFGAGLVALNTSLPPPLMLLAVAGCGIACGAIWAFIPAALKVWLGVNEVLSSLMLNYVAILWVQSLVYGPWREPGGGWPYSAFFPDEARLPSIGSELDICIIAAPLVALAVSVLLRFSRWGFEITVVGHSHEAARYAAISVTRVTIAVMLLSGALAGIAGIQQVSGTAGRLYVLTPGYGYLGILVSWLAGHDPVLVLVMSVFYGILIQGGSALQIAQIDPSLVRIMQAAIILFALAGLTLARRFRPRARLAKVDRA